MGRVALCAPEKKTEVVISAAAQEDESKMKRGGLEAGLRAVLAGRLSFDEFARATDSRWQQIADLLRSRWDVPGWMTREDMKQEMMMTAWRFLWKLDVRNHRRTFFTSKAPVERFIVWNAMHQVVKSATRARIGHRPHRGEGKNMPSCYEIPASALIRDGDKAGDGDVIDWAVHPAPDLDEVIERRLYFKRAARLARGAQRIAFLALAVRPSAEEAAMAIYDDCEVRRTLRCNCEQDALRIVYQAVESLRYCPTLAGTCCTAVCQTQRTTRCPSKVASVISWGKSKRRCVSRASRTSLVCVAPSRTAKAA